MASLNDFQRMLYRSTHIYVMFAFALNLALGCYGDFRPPLRSVQKYVSFFVLLAPFMLLYSFFMEPYWLKFTEDGDHGRVIGYFALQFVFWPLSIAALLEVLVLVRGSRS